MHASPIQVIELSPFRLAPDLEPPATSRFDTPTAWAAFGAAALLHVGATDLHYINNTHFVDFAAFIQSVALDRILAAVLDLDDAPDIDHFLPLDGGIAFFDARGALLLTPQCCCDLSNLQEWAHALENAGTAGWQPIWIGHPLVYLRHVGEDVAVSCTVSEAGPPPAEDEDSLLRMSRERFRSFLADAEAARCTAFDAVRASIARVAPMVPSDVAARLLLAIGADEGTGADAP